MLPKLAELWDQAEERRKVSQPYTEEQFLHCLLEAMNETLRHTVGAFLKSASH